MLRYTILLLALFGVASVLSSDPDSATLARTPAAQCIQKGYIGVCKASNPADRCMMMFCAESRFRKAPLAKHVGPALELTNCGINKACRKGKCVDYDAPFTLGDSNLRGQEHDCVLS